MLSFEIAKVKNTEYISYYILQKYKNRVKFLHCNFILELLITLDFFLKTYNVDIAASVNKLGIS